MVDVYLYQGHASPSDVTLRTVTPDVAAALSVYLYAGHASPNDVVLRYSGELVGGGGITGTFALTTDDVTLASAGQVWIKGPLAFTTDAVTLAATGTVTAGGGSNTGTFAFTTDAVSLTSDAQNIPPPGSFTVAVDYRRPAVLQPVVRMPRVAGVPGGPRMRAAWWRR